MALLRCSPSIWRLGNVLELRRWNDWTGFFSCRPSIFRTVHWTCDQHVWPWWSVLNICSSSVLLWLRRLSVPDASFSALIRGERFKSPKFCCWPQPLDRGSLNFNLNCRIEPHWAQGRNIFDKKKTTQNAPHLLNNGWMDKSAASTLIEQKPQNKCSSGSFKTCSPWCRLIIYFQFSAHPAHLFSLCSHFQPFKEHLEGWCLRAVFCIVWGSRGSVLACCRLVRHLEWNPMWQAPWKSEDLMRTVAAHYRSRCNAYPAYSVSEQKTSALLGLPKAFTPQHTV